MSDEKPERPTYVTLSTMKDRGWTPAVVRDLLGEPDRLVKNPHYRWPELAEECPRQQQRRESIGR